MVTEKRRNTGVGFRIVWKVKTNKYAAWQYNTYRKEAHARNT